MSALFLTALLTAGPVTAPSIESVTDIDGETHPLDGVTVVVFVKTKCPIANYYQPTLRRLSEEWGDDVNLVQVHTESRVDEAEASKHRSEFNVAGVITLDPEQELIEALDATVTPEAFVIDQNGKVRYRGRIDDTYLAFGKRRQTVASPDLANAVQAVLSGEAVPVSKTEAVGCRIRRR